MGAWASRVLAGQQSGDGRTGPYMPSPCPCIRGSILFLSPSWLGSRRPACRGQLASKAQGGSQLARRRQAASWQGAGRRPAGKAQTGSKGSPDDGEHQEQRQHDLCWRWRGCVWRVYCTRTRHIALSSCQHRPHSHQGSWQGSQQQQQPEGQRAVAEQGQGQPHTLRQPNTQAATHTQAPRQLAQPHTQAATHTQATRQ